MRTHSIPPFYRKSERLILPPELALLSTLTGSNYPCLELIFMVPKVFEPLKFDCILILPFSLFHVNLKSFKFPTKMIQIVLNFFYSFILRNQGCFVD